MRQSIAKWAYRIASRVIVWSVVELSERPKEEAARIARREVDAIRDSLEGHFEFQASEQKILDARLSRRFDPGMALNEAATRAIAAKKELRDQVSPSQKAALKVQQEYLQRIVDRS